MRSSLLIVILLSLGQLRRRVLSCSIADAEWSWFQFLVVCEFIFMVDGRWQSWLGAVSVFLV